MSGSTIAGIVVGFVVAVLLVLLVSGVILKRGAAERQRKEALRRAEGLRGEAADHGAGVQSAQEQARDADAAADRARAEVEQAEVRATRAEQAATAAHHDLAAEQAVQEDAVREADRLDPRVDTDADDYRPITGPDMKASTIDPLPADGEGQHRA